MKALRTILGVVAIALFGLAAPARAVLVDLGFDPVLGMSGDVLLNVAQACLNLAPGTHAPPPGCTFNFQSVTFDTGPLLGTFVSTTNPMSVASYQIPNGGNNVFTNLITSADVLLVSPVILLSSVSIDAPCGPALSFGAEGQFNLGTLTLLSCGTTLATASVTAVSLAPEPGTFALLIGAIAAGWLTRRIKRKS